MDKLTYLIKSGLAILLVPIFFACDDPTELGLELDGEDNKLNTQKIEFDLPASTIAIDSLLTDNSTLVTFGKYSDDIFGTTKAIAYANQSISGGYFPDSSDTFVRAFICLSSAYVRSTTTSLSNQTISVHLGEDTLFNSARYLASRQVPYNESPIAERTFSYNRISNHYNNLDSAVLKIDLPEAIGMEYFNKLYNASTDTSRVTLDSLRSGYFFRKPLVFVPGEDNSALINFDLSNDTTAIYIEILDKENSENKFYKLHFRNKHYSNIQRDRSGSVLSDLSTEYVESSNAGGVAYLDMISGIHTKLDLQPYLDFVAQSENLIINQALLSMETTDLAHYLDSSYVGTINFLFIRDDGRINGPGLGFSMIENGLMTDNSYQSYGSSSASPQLQPTVYNIKSMHYSSPSVTLFSQILLDQSEEEEVDYLTNELVLSGSNNLDLRQSAFSNSAFKLTVFYTNLK
ncbi:MAG: DUF4270 family protein [Marinoscillum sp.]